MSANDLIELHSHPLDEIAVIDLRIHLEFNRAHLKDSINIPFSLISLGDVRLEVLNIPDLEARLANKIVIIASNSYENAVLICFVYAKTKFKIKLLIFSLLIFCWIAARNGFNILHSYLLETS